MLLLNQRLSDLIVFCCFRIWSDASSLLTWLWEHRLRKTTRSAASPSWPTPTVWWPSVVQRTFTGEPTSPCPGVFSCWSWAQRGGWGYRLARAGWCHSRATEVAFLWLCVTLGVSPEWQHLTLSLSLKLIVCYCQLLHSYCQWVEPNVRSQSR